MALRDVKQFDTKQMIQLKDNLESGASQKQVANLQRAQEHLAESKPKSNF